MEVHKRRAAMCGTRASRAATPNRVTAVVVGLPACAVLTLGRVAGSRMRSVACVCVR